MMNLKRLTATTIALTTVNLSGFVTPQATATDIYTCQALSNRLEFLYDDGEAGYFISGDIFPCTILDSYTLHTFVNGYPVVFVHGSVSVDGYPFIVRGGTLFEAD
ncbi:hypothetical protein C7B61_08915 [filamentous cyanobacterium CCP1]|nr:hypothetical protein C7B76_22020 [filamentous cyanobacterium CCP2]PSB66912.1 hypothetical protein C7B61_08915 [filamentous cyanobacterium CCP1]